MKKLLLTLALFAFVATPAVFAEEGTDTTGTSGDVTADTAPMDAPTKKDRKAARKAAKKASKKKVKKETTTETTTESEAPMPDAQ